jgi:receptor protein-tyrosine kinase
MSIVQQAAKRLEELRRAGVAMPPAAVDLVQDQTNGLAEALPRPTTPIGTSPAAAMRRVSAEPANAGQALLAPARGPAVDETRITVTVDLERLERAGYLVPTSARSVQAEEFRHIKRPLLKNAQDKEPGETRLSQIMVTSALPGEGKTFCAINLAMSMAAEIDTSVLLVDADVLHPTVLQRLGIAEHRGLLDILADPALDVVQLVLATNVPKLSILPAGTRNDRSTELLASNAMEALLGKLAERYPNHVIIFDAPPLLLTNEAKVLASRIGQVVLVVEASKTPRSVVAQAFAAVEQCPVVMSVLNKAPESATPHGYGYYYG